MKKETSKILENYQEHEITYFLENRKVNQEKWLIKSKLENCKLNRWVNLKIIQDAARP